MQQTENRFFVCAVSFVFVKIFGTLAPFQCLWKSCEWDVKLSTGLRTFFACSAEDSRGESKQFEAVQSGPANLNELRGTTGAKHFVPARVRTPKRDALGLKISFHRLCTPVEI